MSDFIKNLKSIFIVEEEPLKAPEEKPAEAASPVPTPVKGTVTPAVSEGKINEKFIGVLFEAMSTQNLEGFDYLEFKQSLKSLEKMPMDEATRYQSAYAMAQTMGINAAKLVETAQHYLTILGNEQQKFNEAVNKQRLQQIGNREEQINQLGKAIAEKQEKIKQMSAEVEDHARQMELLKKEIEQSTVKVESTRNDFSASYQALTTQISSDIENIKKYLK